MSTAPECLLHRNDDTAVRWVAGTLPSEEADRLEIHLLECEACQAAVQRAAVLRATLRELPAPRSRIRWWPLLVPVGLAAAALVWLRPSVNPIDQLAETGPAPTFLAEPIRAGPGIGAADRGMAAYAAGDFRRAAQLLDSALIEDPTTATRFYLGIARIKAGDAVGGATALEPLADDSPSPYSAEAALWLAKAWLRARNLDSAQAVLIRLGQRQDEPALAAHARALADSIREATRR